MRILSSYAFACSYSVMILSIKACVYGFEITISSFPPDAKICCLIADDEWDGNFDVFTDCYLVLPSEEDLRRSNRLRSPKPIPKASLSLYGSFTSTEKSLSILELEAWPHVKYSEVSTDYDAFFSESSTTDRVEVFGLELSFELILTSEELFDSIVLFVLRYPLCSPCPCVYLSLSLRC